MGVRVEKILDGGTRIIIIDENAWHGEIHEDQWQSCLCANPHGISLVLLDYSAVGIITARSPQCSTISRTTLSPTISAASKAGR